MKKYLWFGVAFILLALLCVHLNFINSVYYTKYNITLARIDKDYNTMYKYYDFDKIVDTALNESFNDIDPLSFEGLMYSNIRNSIKQNAIDAFKTSIRESKLPEELSNKNKAQLYLHFVKFQYTDKSKIKTNNKNLHRERACDEVGCMLIEWNKEKDIWKMTKMENAD